MQILSTILSFFALLSLVMVGGCSKRAEDSGAEASGSSADSADDAATIAPQITPDVVTNAKPDGSATLRQLISEQSNGMMELASYEKTNGFDEGPGHYTLEYRAQVTSTDDCYRYAKMDAFRNKIEPSRKFSCRKFDDLNVTEKRWHIEEMDSSTNTVDPNYVLVLAPKGILFELTGTLSFQNTERGWRSIRQ